VSRCVNRSCAGPGGSTTSIMMSTAPETGIDVVGAPPGTGWVTDASASPSRRKTTPPPGTSTSTDVSVTGAKKVFVSTRS
jgi:hypothetical protein